LFGLFGEGEPCSKRSARATWPCRRSPVGVQRRGSCERQCGPAERHVLSTSVALLTPCKRQGELVKVISLNWTWSGLAGFTCRSTRPGTTHRAVLIPLRLTKLVPPESRARTCKTLRWTVSASPRFLDGRHSGMARPLRPGLPAVLAESCADDESPLWRTRPPSIPPPFTRYRFDRHSIIP
jgi:hypothetical protein